MKKHQKGIVKLVEKPSTNLNPIVPSSASNSNNTNNTITNSNANNNNSNSEGT